MRMKTKPAAPNNGTAKVDTFMAGLKQDEAISKIRAAITGCAEVDNLLAFIERSERGICRG